MPDPLCAGNHEIAARLALLEAQIEADIEAHTAPGLSIAVAHGDATIWARGFGKANLETEAPATPETVYAVGSITKLFTATLLMQLRDAGKLRLDDPVQDILPDVQVPHRHPGGPAITLRHLVTHTSGLVKDSSVGYWDSTVFPPVETLMEALAHTDQPYPPGVRWKYSNLGIALLGYALARVAGQKWEACIAERVLAPLGMAASAPRLQPRQEAQLAAGYAHPAGGWPPARHRHQELGGIGAGGAMHTTVPDMARFISAQFATSPSILSAASIAEMHRPIWVAEDWQWGQAIGWRVLRAADGGTRIEHGGGVHGFTCKVLLSVPDRLGVAVFTNGSDGSVGQGVASRTLDLLIPAVRRIAARAEPMPAPMPAEFDQYLGHSRWILGEMEVIRRDGQLVMLSPAASGTETVMLRPEGEHAFRLFGSQVHGELLRFVADAEGRFTRAWAGPHPYTRI